MISIGLRLGRHAWLLFLYFVDGFFGPQEEGIIAHCGAGVMGAVKFVASQYFKLPARLENSRFALLAVEEQPTTDKCR